jgi:L-2-hydroxyglutarate oxidase
MISGEVHAGPNAVMALDREGYSLFHVNLKEVISMIGYPGFPLFMKNHFNIAVEEVHRSLSKKKFASDLSRLVPELVADDMIKGDSGVRAQALGQDGKLIDDFVFEVSSTQLHVLNAPSPAATASFAIARHLIQVINSVRT